MAYVAMNVHRAFIWSVFKFLNGVCRHEQSKYLKRDSQQGCCVMGVDDMQEALDLGFLDVQGKKTDSQHQSA